MISRKIPVAPEANRSYHESVSKTSTVPPRPDPAPPAPSRRQTAYPARVQASPCPGAPAFVAREHLASAVAFPVVLPVPAFAVPLFLDTGRLFVQQLRGGSRPPLSLTLDYGSSDKAARSRTLSRLPRHQKGEQSMNLIRSLAFATVFAVALGAFGQTTASTAKNHQSSPSAGTNVDQHLQALS